MTTISNMFPDIPTYVITKNSDITFLHLPDIVHNFFVFAVIILDMIYFAREVLK